MLNQDGLIEALKNGQGAANTCGHWCRAGATVENDTYILFHNGTGSRDTDSQVVHSSEVHGWTATKLGERIAAWITGLHRGERLNLNATMEEAIEGVTDAHVIGAILSEIGQPYIVGERGPELFITSSAGTIDYGRIVSALIKPEYLSELRGPAMIGWPFSTRETG